MELNEIKEYLRIDGIEEDVIIMGLQVAAEEYLINAGVIKDYTKGLYKLAIKLLVAHWYENRILEAVGNRSTKLTFSLDAIITQLKYCQSDVSLS